MNKYFWFVEPYFYHKMNELIKTNYSKNDIDYFIGNCPKGIYATNRDNSVDYCSGYMDFPCSSSGEDSNLWLTNNNYKYMGEISLKSFRLEKLKKLKKYENSKTR